MIRIVLADDQKTAIEYLRSQLSSAPELEIVGTASNGQEAIAAIHRLQPDVLLLDLEMPTMDGLTVAHTLRQQAIATKVLILSEHRHPSYIKKALQAGVQGYLLKSSPADELVSAIQSVHKGFFQIGRKVIEYYVQDSPVSAPPPMQAASLLQKTEAALLRVTEPQNSALVPTSSALTQFDRPVLLQQSPLWSRAILWGIVGCTTAAIAWACLFQIEEAIPATGQLEPIGAVKDIQSPISGVVQEVLIKEGQAVKAGEVLLRLNPQAAQSELTSLQSIRRNLMQENNYYQRQMEGAGNGPIPPALNPQWASLTLNRQALVAENQLHRAQLNGNSGQKFSSEERQRLTSGIMQETANMAAAHARVHQSDKQMGQIHTQLEQTNIQLASAQSSLTLNRGIVKDIEAAYQKGAVARVQFQQQQEKVQISAAEVAHLQQEKIRLLQQMEQVDQEKAQAQAQSLNTLATQKREILDQISDNQQRITDIDSQLTKVIMDNEKKIAELDNRLNQTRLTLEHQELRAPVDGVVFDLKAKSAGFVAEASAPLLKIVPSKRLTAKVYITNQDIGFVQKKWQKALDHPQNKQDQMDVDVRIDSYPFSEFGDIKGRVVSLGSDALAPTEMRPFYSFPAEVELDSQTLEGNGLSLPLQSGMSVSVNIKVRQRSVISLITDTFTREADNMKHLR